jgi:hypothetical protein
MLQRRIFHTPPGSAYADWMQPKPSRRPFTGGFWVSPYEDTSCVHSNLPYPKQMPPDAVPCSFRNKQEERTPPLRRVATTERVGFELEHAPLRNWRDRCQVMACPASHHLLATDRRVGRPQQRRGPEVPVGKSQRTSRRRRQRRGALTSHGPTPLRKARASRVVLS